MAGRWSRDIRMWAHRVERAQLPRLCSRARCRKAPEPPLCDTSPSAPAGSSSGLSGGAACWLRSPAEASHLMKWQGRGEPEPTASKCSCLVHVNAVCQPPRHFFLQRLPADDAAQLAPALTPARGGERRASAFRGPGRRRRSHRAARRTCQQRRPPRLAAKEKPPWLRRRRWQPGARAARRPPARRRWPGAGELALVREAQGGRATMARP